MRTIFLDIPLDSFIITAGDGTYNCDIPYLVENNSYFWLENNQLTTITNTEPFVVVYTLDGIEYSKQF